MSSAIEKTLEHALFLARHLKHCDYSTVVTLILFELGVAPKNDGFEHLKRAVAMRVKNPTRQLKGDIYSELDGAGDDERVEQSIRRSITDAWKNRDDEIWSIYFPQMKNGKLYKPSNGDFIAYIAWFVELWQGCCKEVSYAKER